MENLREQKGRQIALTRQIKQVEDGFAVQSQTSKRFYFVDSNGACNCPDFQTRGGKCKHVFATQFFLQKITHSKDGAIKIETKRLTHPQAWSAYNKSQETEKARFLELLNDLIEEPTEQGKRGRGQPRINEHDLLFASTLKVYSLFSLRRFMSDLNEAKEKDFIEKKPCFASVGHFMQRSELTPILQRLILLSAAPLKSVETKFAINSTGFRTNHFLHYCQEKRGESKTHEFLKLHAVVGCKTNVITACEVTESEGKGTGDSSQFNSVVNSTAKTGFTIQEFSADKAYTPQNYKYLFAVISSWDSSRTQKGQKQLVLASGLIL